jgi:two-component system, response regulator RegA
MTNTHADYPSLLLADDDRTFSQVLAKALEARGYAVATAHDGESALRQIDETTPEYAVIDLRLPDMSGLKLVERLKAVDAHTNIVCLTGYGSIATAIEAIKLGATHYLTKPANADQVVAAFGNKAPNPGIDAADHLLSVERLEWEHIQGVLTRHDGNISATSRALNMHRRTLQRKLHKNPPRP